MVRPCSRKISNQSERGLVPIWYFSLASATSIGLPHLLVWIKILVFLKIRYGINATTVEGLGRLVTLYVFDITL